MTTSSPPNQTTEEVMREKRLRPDLRPTMISLCDEVEKQCLRRERDSWNTEYTYLLPRWRELISTIVSDFITSALEAKEREIIKKVVEVVNHNVTWPGDYDNTIKALNSLFKSHDNKA